MGSAYAKEVRKSLAIASVSDPSVTPAGASATLALATHASSVESRATVDGASAVTGW
jgi:hypothetical protein